VACRNFLIRDPFAIRYLLTYLPRVPARGRFLNKAPCYPPLIWYFGTATRYLRGLLLQSRPPVACRSSLTRHPVIHSRVRTLLQVTVPTRLSSIPVRPTVACRNFLRREPLSTRYLPTCLPRVGSRPVAEISKQGTLFLTVELELCYKVSARFPSTIKAPCRHAEIP
jgi:hypothetical protein